MTPMNPQSTDKTANGFITGLAIGLGATVVILGIAGIGGYAVATLKNAEVRKGWNLVPVVVAGREISEGRIITVEDLSQRSIPEQLVTSSVVKPDSSKYVLNLKTLVPMMQGDPLLWSQFETKPPPPALFATKDIPIGKAIAEDDVEDRPVKTSLTTDSWVLTRDRPQALGCVVVAPFRRGDPILWTHLTASGAK